MNINVKDLDDALIICPNDYKEKILEYFNNEKIIANAAFITLNEYKKKYTFDYDVNAIKYLTNTGLSVSNAKEILDNIVYVENKNYSNEKLDKLVEYRNDLESKNLLIYDPLFKQYIKSKNIIVIGYDELNKHDLNLLVGKSIKIISDKRIDKKYRINIFSNIEEEVEFVYNSIYDLLEKGVNINNIYILNANDDYCSYFKRFNKFYHFNVEYKEDKYLYGTCLAKTFLEMLEQSTKEEIYEYLKNCKNESAETLNNILNKYAEFEIKETKELIIEDVRSSKTSISNNDVVKCVNLFNCFDENDYVFLIGFNETVPTMEKDISYITNNIRELVGIPKTEENNELKKKNLINYLSNIDNLVLTYCENTPFNAYNKQILISKDRCEYIENKLNNDYSDELNKSKYTDKLDKLRKFNSLQDNIDLLFNKYGKNNYLTYNNRFKGLNNNQTNLLTKQINTVSNRENSNELTLSYSTMNKYFECAFKYYLDTVLNVKEPFGNYYTKLGTVCHGVLKDYYNDLPFDFDKSWAKQIESEEKKEDSQIFQDESEKHFVNKLKEELRKDIEIVKIQKENSLLNNQKCENFFSNKVTDRISFIGYIDKLMFKETDDEIIASVVDYKTNKEIEIDKDIMKYGLSLQLPSYLYLIKHSKEFNKEIKFAGLYIQHLINYDNKYIDENTDLFDSKLESMKLDGISSSCEDRIQALDITLQPSSKSQTIKSISMNKDGSLKKSNRLYSDSQFQELNEIVEKSIKIAGNSILEGKFNINPKQIDGENVSCTYCKYAPICYKKASDLICLSTQEND